VNTSAPGANGSRTPLSGSAVVALCMFVVVMEGYNLITFGITVPLLLDDTALGLDPATAGLIGGVVYAGGLIGILVSGPLADRWGRHRLMSVAVGVFAVGAVLVALAPNAMVIGLARVLTGIGIGAAFTSAMTLARNHATVNRASLVITLTTAGVPIGGVLASLFGIFLMPHWGWRSNYWAGAVLTLVILAVSLACHIREPEEVRNTTLTPSRRLTSLFAPSTRVVVIFVALASVVNLVTWLGLNAWLAEAMRSSGFSLTQALTLTFVLTGAAVIGSWFTATAGDRVGPAKVAVVCAALTLAGLLGLLTDPASLVLAIIFVGLMGIGGHSTQNLISAAATNQVAPPLRGTVIAITNAMAYVGSFLGPVVGGRAFAAGGAPSLWALYAGCAAVCLAMTVGIVAGGRRTAGDGGHRGSGAGSLGPDDARIPDPA
jgi:AAHS family benzoate transporter-like MFS transporter